MSKMKRKRIRNFQENLMDWWSQNSRELPWREEPTPYHVLVSEIMLQQTQVGRVIPKYQEFLNEFPDLDALANSDKKHLLRTWSGLGYNRRALWLREAAKEILRKGEFPRTKEELKRLKGIGPYTSRSILIFAFNQDVAAVDTNVRRVLIASGFATEDMSSEEIQDIAEQLVPKGESRDWHNALMDYGSEVLTSKRTGISPRSSQTTYSGSSRQIRGLVVKVMTMEDVITIDQLQSKVKEKGLDSDKVVDIIEDLVKEGFLDYSDSGSLSIAN